MRIYHDQALYKEPGGGCTPWHADGYYFPLSSGKILTAWVPLQPVPKVMVRTLQMLRVLLNELMAAAGMDSMSYII